MKHVDFIILDILCLQAALTLAYACSGYGWDIYTPILYRNVAMFLGLADLMLLICRETMKGVIRRGHFREFTMTVKQAAFISVPFTGRAELFEAGIASDAGMLQRCGICSPGALEMAPTEEKDERRGKKRPSDCSE